MSVEQKIKDYILENYLFTDDQSALDNSDSFLGKGMINSTGMLEVIYFIEDAFGVIVADNEMIPDNLDSVDKIAKFINSKK